MLYIERQPRKRSVVLLVLVGLLLYGCALYLYELRPADEGLQAAMSREMMWSGDFVKTHLYGRPVREYPLYSWLVSLFSGFGSPRLWSLRLPSLLSILGLSLVSGFAARRLQSNFSGFIAAAIVVLSVVSFRVGVRAQVELLQSLLTCSAWWAWYHFGVEGKRWNVAWEVSLLLVFVGVLNVGLQAVFWFYLPLLFMPRQVNAKMRMQMPVHVVSALVVMLLIMVWEWVTPDQPLMPWNREPGLMASEAAGGSYLWHLVAFPWKCVAYLLPWSILIWAPFCIALRPFERVPVACRYFRVIVITLFLAVWFTPGTSPLNLLNLLGPVAILIGVHFEIVIRRYQRFLDRIVRTVSWVGLVGCVLVSLTWFMVAAGVIAVMDVSPLEGILQGLPLLALAVVLWFLVLCRKTGERFTFRTRIIWCICAIRMLSLFTFEYYGQWNDRDRRWAGEMLAGQRPPAVQTAGLPAFLPCTIQPEETPLDRVNHIYYCPARNSGFLYLVELFYVDKPIVYVPQGGLEGRLNKEAKSRVHVLSDGVPAVASYKWRAISPVVGMGVHRNAYAEWRSAKQGEALLPLIRLGRKTEGATMQGALAKLQLYEGTPLNE